MNLVLGFFSGVLLFTTLPNLFHVMNILGQSPAQFNTFDNLTQSTWLAKPILGYFSDSFHPFHYRIKSYVIIMTVIMAGSCYLITITSNSLSIFTLLVSLIYFAVGFVDTQAEGLTAVITKMETRLAELKKEIGLANEEDVNSNENIGNFLMLRNLFRFTAIFLGGFLVDQKVSIKIIYIILGLSPASLLIFTLFFFTELKVKFK